MNDDLLDIDFGTAKQDEAKILAHGMAEKIRDHIDAMGWTRKRQARWEKAFELLIEQHGQDAVRDRVKSYIALKITRPKVQSGDDFRNNWDWIGEEIANQAITSVSYSDLTILEQEIVTEVLEMGWPASVTDSICGVVRRSEENLRIFKARLFGELKLRNIYRELVVHLDTMEHLVWFFRVIHKKYAGWKQWSGDLTAHVWSVNHGIVAAHLRQVLIAWAGEDDGSWAKVLEVVK